MSRRTSTNRKSSGGNMKMRLDSKKMPFLTSRHDRLRLYGRQQPPPLDLPQAGSRGCNVRFARKICAEAICSLDSGVNKEMLHKVLLLISSLMREETSFFPRPHRSSIIPMVRVRYCGERVGVGLRVRGAFPAEAGPMGLGERRP